MGVVDSFYVVIEPVYHCTDGTSTICLVASSSVGTTVD